MHSIKITPLLILIQLLISLNFYANCQQAESGLLTVIASSYIRPQSDYSVLISLAESKVPASVDVQVTGAKDSNREQVEVKSVLIGSGETQTLKFNIGNSPPAEYVLNVTAQAIDRSWNFTNEAIINYQQKDYLGFIQTDKAIYKPGQTVQFRALFLTRTLRPQPLKDAINVTIVDPKRNIVKQWTNLSNWRGLLSLEAPLSDEPMLGDWTIKVSAANQEFSKQFTVAEYILPTFDVTIQLANYATYNESEVVATVKAKYTYGKAVNGHVTLTVQPLVRFHNLDTRPLQQMQYRARLKNGLASFELDIKKDLKLESELFQREIEFFALVEEDLTGRKYNKTQTLPFYDRSIKIDYLNEEDKFYKRGLSHKITLAVSYQDGIPIENNGPELELTLLDHNSDIVEKVRLRPKDGLVHHKSDLTKNSTNVGTLRPEVNYRGLKYHLDALEAEVSRSGHHLKIVLPQVEARESLKSNQPLKVGDDLHVQLKASEPMQQVNCQGLTRGELIWALSLAGKNRSELEFNVKLEQRMAPEASILCFYGRPSSSELIADSKRLSVAGLANNQVSLALSRAEAKPGQEVELALATKPHALVAVLALDQSSLLLKSGNDLSRAAIEEALGLQDKQDSDYFRSMDSHFKRTGVIYMTNGKLETPPLFLPIYFTSLTSQKIQLQSSRPIETGQLNPPEFKASKRATSEPPVIRSFFPETWLWINKTADSNGNVLIKSKVPDSITSWTLSAFSMSEAAGLGLTEVSSSLRVFRSFFIKLNLPYSLIRGETVNIQAIVFNYSKRRQNVRVTLENRNSEFEFVEAANRIEDESRSSKSSEWRSINVDADSASSADFLITPTQLGYIEIRVLAQSDFESDGISRKLLVKPEGQIQHFNVAMLVNLPNEAGEKWSRNVTIEVPSNAVAGSQRVSVAAVGDVLGSGLSNLNDLVRLPYGCGEQNMIHLVPNIAVLSYLDQSGRISDGQRAKPLKNIELGYQRQLNYRRSDGSFSAFGSADANGSVWLTAYVLKTFQQARQFIHVDESVVAEAARFIALQSKPDGSITEVGMLHHKALQSEAAEATGTYLTAYSLIALLQAPLPVDASQPEDGPTSLAEVIKRAIGYLERRLEAPEDSMTSYELSIVAYALQLAGSEASSQLSRQRLWSRAQRDQEQSLWWAPLARGPPGELERESEPEVASTSARPPPLRPLPVQKRQSAHLMLPDSLAVETEALALLASVKRRQLDQALPLVKWLVNQQNSAGGFASTQDTVLAIEALAAYAQATSAQNKSLLLDVELAFPLQSSQQQQQPQELPGKLRRLDYEQIVIARSNALIQQQVRLPENCSWVQLKATGVGSAVLQVSWQYNLAVSGERAAFYLSTNLDRSSNANYLQLSVCTFYKAAGRASNMAVAEVELPSGYAVDVEALQGLKHMKLVKRVETSDGDTKALIYLDQVTRDELCFTITGHRTSLVSNNRRVPVTIYDYYDRKKAARVFYEAPNTSSCDICKSQECERACASKPKRSDRLVSLHEQRRLELPAGSSSRLLNSSDIHSAGSSNSSTKLLPLAPVLMSFVSAARNFY